MISILRALLAIGAAIAATAVARGGPPIAQAAAAPHAKPAYAPRNYVGDPTMPAGIRRVVLLPVCTGNVAPPETALTLDTVLLTALQKQTRFEVVTMSREDCQHLFGAPEFLSTAALPAGFLDKIAARYAADAVLFVDLTVYQPYRPLAVGFRSKLATFHDVRLVWSFDEVISSTTPGVAELAKQRYRQGARADEPLDLSPAILQSPGRFANFVADAMFQTLPAR